VVMEGWGSGRDFGRSQCARVFSAVNEAGDGCVDTRVVDVHRRAGHRKARSICTASTRTGRVTRRPKDHIVWSWLRPAARATVKMCKWPCLAVLDWLVT
jgi:hypothetical protein